ncbi:MAG TPA: heavy metal-binding domain-containing protein, partial [Chitinophagaceae bacterium]|nr:heavy metal-binding domain-containing protein [Chitinophagaceae bacterium]
MMCPPPCKPVPCCNYSEDISRLDDPWVRAYVFEKAVANIKYQVMKEFVFIAFLTAVCIIGTAQTSKVVYTCSMHSELRLEKPGNCPKCGMKLVKETQASTPSKQVPKSKDNDPSNQAHAGKMHNSPGANATDTLPISYTCPMHPEVHTGK